MTAAGRLGGPFIAVMLLAACGGDAPGPTRVMVATAAPIAESSPRFLSFSIDASNVARPYDFTRPRLRRLARELGPAYLRIGGTDSDRIYYDLSDTPVAVAPAPHTIVLTRAWWDSACGFATDLGLQILFTLNAGPGPRAPVSGRWTPDNARALLAYTRASGCPVAVWELGNEVNGFPTAHGFTLSGRDYAADIALARALLDQEHPGAKLAGPADLYFPVAGGIATVIPDFLTQSGPLVDIVSWHYYPQQSSKCPVATRRASVDTLFDPANLDEVTRWAAEVEGHRDRLSPGAAVWLGETGHALCGGEAELSDRFVTGFWWLDQLALIARRGEPVVVRQALTGGRYHLIDNTTLEPSPDYWNSLLWKRLMGARVLDAQGGTEKLRAYAHCTPGRPGAVTVLAINLDRSHDARIELTGLGRARELYLVTGPDLVGKEVRLNGVTLAADPDGAPPPLAPVASHDPIVLPAQSYAFVVIGDAQAAACP